MTEEEVLSSEVVIIGGGVIGASCAYYLSKAGVEVTVVEEVGIGSGTSGSCDGFVMCQSKKPGFLLDIAIKSREMFDELSEELESDIEWKKCGSLVIARSEVEMEALRAWSKELEDAGLETEILDGKQSRDLEPALSESIVGASLCMSDGQVNPLELTFAFIEAAKRNGASVLTGRTVENILVMNERIREVHLNTGRIHTRRVVCAAGVGSNEIGKMIIVDIPIMPWKGQLLVTEQTDKLIEHIICDARYIGTKLSIDSMIGEEENALKLGLGLSIEQTESGNLLIGSTRQFLGIDKATTEEAMNLIAKNAFDAFQGIDNLEVIRTFAGLRPFSPDGMPIIGMVKGIKYFYLATGHAGDGICLSPITGKIIADMVTGEEPEIDIKPLALYRFH